METWLKTLSRKAKGGKKRPGNTKLKCNYIERRNIAQ